MAGSIALSATGSSATARRRLVRSTPISGRRCGVFGAAGMSPHRCIIGAHAARTGQSVPARRRRFNDDNRRHCWRPDRTADDSPESGGAPTAQAAPPRRSGCRTSGRVPIVCKEPVTPRLVSPVGRTQLLTPARVADELSCPLVAEASTCFHQQTYCHHHPPLPPQDYQASQHGQRLLV